VLPSNRCQSSGLSLHVVRIDITTFLSKPVIGPLTQLLQFRV